MTAPTITTSGCDGHCYCQSNTIGQRYCCKCGAFAQPVPGRSECVCGTVNGYWQDQPLLRPPREPAAMTTPILRCGFPVQPVIIDNHPRKLPYRDCGAVAAYRVVASLWGTRKTLGYTCVEHKLTPHAGVLWRIEEVEE